MEAMIWNTAAEAVLGVKASQFQDLPEGQQTNLLRGLKKAYIADMSAEPNNVNINMLYPVAEQLASLVP